MESVVFFAVGNEPLNSMYMNFYFKGLKLKKNFKEQDVSNDAVSVILHVSLFPKLIWML
jgi:hypothetical protein